VWGGALFVCILTVFTKRYKWEAIFTPVDPTVLTIASYIYGGPVLAVFVATPAMVVVYMLRHISLPGKNPVVDMEVSASIVAISLFVSSIPVVYSLARTYIRYRGGEGPQVYDIQVRLSLVSLLDTHANDPALAITTCPREHRASVATLGHPTSCTTTSSPFVAHAFTCVHLGETDWLIPFRLDGQFRYPSSANSQVIMAGCFAIFALVFLCTDSPVGMQPDDEDASTAALPTVSSWSTPTQRPSTCPEILPQDRVVLFWQSEVGGCEQVPNGVTHVVFGFAQTFGGIVTPSFQGAVASCVQSLRQRCMYVMGVIGGANNNVGMSTIHDPQAFAASVKSFVQQYLLDGVDIDDETSYFEGLYDDHRALHTALKTNGNDYLLSYDAYMLEADPVCWKSTLPYLTSFCRICR
ncbi:hypothetical protein DYB31_012459, partial [Aphanomyces astaci]